MNLHVGSFCCPTIRTLMQRVQATQKALHTAPDAEWNVANDADIRAVNALCDGLSAATGLTRDELRQLGELI